MIRYFANDDNTILLTAAETPDLNSVVLSWTCFDYDKQALDVKSITKTKKEAERLLSEKKYKIVKIMFDNI